MSDKPYDESSPTTFHPSRFDLERQLLQHFIHLHTSQPHHEIFGERTKGLLRLPLYNSQPTGQSWASICRIIALSYKKSKSKFFRLLCFVADPTHPNWASPGNGTLKHCRHSCSGQQQNNGHIAYCINGIYHGKVGSRTVRTSSHPPLADISPSIPHSARLDLEQHLFQLFIGLQTSNPNHEIFGEPALVRLPLYSSWSRGQRLVRVLAEMKSAFQLEACWMLRSKYIQIDRKSSGKKATCFPCRAHSPSLEVPLGQWY
ncbi:hypothetical protein V1527DRAFT_495178 [Lipomyces starkeyi]